MIQCSIPTPLRGRCSRPACSPSWWASPPAASRRPRPSRSPSAPRTSPARRPSRRPTGRRSRTRATTSRFKDNLGATEIVYAALENGDLDVYGDYQGTLLTYLGGTPTGDSAETYKAPAGEARGHRHRGEQAGARGRRQRLLRHQGHGQEVQAQEGVRPHQGRAASSRSADRPSARTRPLCLGDTSQQLYGLEVQGGQEARRRRPDHGPGARGRRHRRRPPLHRQQRDPEGRGAAHRRQGPAAGRQPGVPDPQGQGHAGDAEDRSTRSRRSSPPRPTTRCRSTSARTRKTRPTWPPPS